MQALQSFDLIEVSIASKFSNKMNKIDFEVQEAKRLVGVEVHQGGVRNVHLYNDILE